MDQILIPRSPETVRSQFRDSLSAKLDPFIGSPEARRKLRETVELLAEENSLEATRFVRRVLSECYLLHEKPPYEPPMEFVRVVTPCSLVLVRGRGGISIVNAW